MRTEFKRKESGAGVIFMAACILPIVFLLLSLSLDLTNYLKKMRDVTQLMDDAAIYAYRYMPDRKAAASAARSYVGVHAPNLLDGLEITSDESGLLLRYAGQQPFFFAELLGVKKGIPISAISKVRGTVFDALIMMDVSSYLAPQDKPWTNDIKASDPTPWYAADFFDGYSENGQDPLLLTQRCFNPAINPIKASVLAAVNFYSQTNLNAVGVVVYPASDVQDLFMVHPVAQIGTFQTNWSPYADFQRYCVAAAESETGNVRYAFPTDVEQSRLNGSTAYNPDYAPDISDVVWSYPVQNRVGDFATALQSVRANLIASGIVKNRGGLAGRAQKVAFFIAGDLPWIAKTRYPEGNTQGAVIRALNSVKEDVFKYNQDLKIYYVFWGNLANEKYSMSPVSSLIETFSQVSEQNDHASFQAKVIYTDSFDSAMSGHILERIFLDQRSAVIAK